jgi:hypothetical protein
MKRFLRIALSIVILTSLPLVSASAQTQPWRFGWEWNEFGYPDALFEKLLRASGQQSVPGDININVIGGGWIGMQPNETSPIDFSQTDIAVQRLQNYGFSLEWNLRMDAA